MIGQGTSLARYAGVALAALGVLASCRSSDDEAGTGGPKDASGEARDRDASDTFENDDAIGGGDAAVVFDGAYVEVGDSGQVEITDAASLDGSTDVDAMLSALEDLPYARSVVSFTAGSGAGYGQTRFPEVVLGPPKGVGSGSGALSVMSLGLGGVITLDFGDDDIVDGPGADFIVFENAFWGSGDPTMVFAELAEVSVSEDGVTWHEFVCNEAGSGAGKFPGCAGWTPTKSFDPQQVFPLDPKLTGGDAFDLATLGLERARFVRILDLQTQPAASNTGGFDLDAIGLVNFERRTD